MQEPPKLPGVSPPYGVSSIGILTECAQKVGTAWPDFLSSLN